MIKTFTQFMTESKEDVLSKEAKVSALVQEIDRNYHNYSSLSTVHLQEINFVEEKREWPNFAEITDLAKVKNSPCKFYLKLEKGSEQYQVQFDFNVKSKGIENWDKPDFNPNMPEQTERVGVSLEGLHLTKIQVKSTTMEYVQTNFGKDLGKTVLRFLINILKPLFDNIGDEALLIRQL